MKALLNVEVEPFIVPNFVRVKGGSLATEGSAVSLSACDEQTLERLCDEFASEVFKKAGKERLPTAAVRREV